MMRMSEWLKKGIRFLMYFIKFLVVNVLRLRENIVLYGSGFNAFNGHSKYKFLNDKSSESIWVCSSSEEKKEVVSLGYRAVLKYSILHFVLAARTNEIYITHNISDVFPVKLHGWIVHNLWHGVPIKKIGFDSIVERKWIDTKISSSLRLPYEEWDYVYAQSNYHKELLIRSFKINGSKIIIRTPPSIDFIKNNIRQENGCVKKVVLYLPTFRLDKSNSYIVSSSIKKICDRFDIDEYKVVVKLHPLVSIDEDAFLGDVTFVKKSYDVFRLLGLCDELVSDYSSVVYDFHLARDKKVFLIQDDIESYSESIGGLYDIKVPHEIL